MTSSGSSSSSSSSSSSVYSPRSRPILDRSNGVNKRPDSLRCGCLFDESSEESIAVLYSKSNVPQSKTITRRVVKIPSRERTSRNAPSRCGDSANGMQNNSSNKQTLEQNERRDYSTSKRPPKARSDNTEARLYTVLSRRESRKEERKGGEKRAGEAKTRRGPSSLCDKPIRDKGPWASRIGTGRLPLQKFYRGGMGEICSPTHDIYEG